MENKPKNPAKKDVFYQFHSISAIESATDMTGLTPSPPITFEDAQSYSEIYPMPMIGKAPMKRRPDERWRFKD